MRTFPILVLCVLITSFASLALTAGEPCRSCAQSPCAESCCEKYRCELQPAKVEKEVVCYDYKWVPYCNHKLPPFLHCESCPTCGCVKFKKVLVKRVMKQETCGTKCTPVKVGDCGSSCELLTPPLPSPPPASK